VLHRAGKRWILNADGSFKSHISPFSGKRACCGRGGNCAGCMVFAVFLSSFLGGLKKLAVVD
jgi:hypothetical protein